MPDSIARPTGEEKPAAPLLPYRSVSGGFSDSSLDISSVHT